MASLFRQTMLLNSILCNSEVLYGISKTHIETLESVDKFYWKKVFQCPVSTPTEALFLETNSIPIRYVIMSRRLMYYWSILQMDETELVKKVYTAQQLSPCKDDWIYQLREDLKECNILQSECEIKSMKIYTYRNLVKKQIQEVSTKYLLSLKMKNNVEKSKSKNIWPSDDMKMYLRSNELSTDEKRLLFSMRCRVNEVKCNYKSKYRNDMSCSLCSSNVDESEMHLLQCEAIVSEPEVKDDISEIEYSDIFSDIKKQIKAVKIWKKIFRIRNWKSQNRTLSSSGHQAHLLSASYAPDTPVTVDISPLPGDSSTNLQNMILDVYDFGT